MKSRGAQIAALIAVCCAMVAGIASILQNRAHQPASYPAFSSYRTLPEGTSVFYEALRHSAGMTAERNIQPLVAVHFENAAIVMLGIPPDALFGGSITDVEDLAGQGNRVIIGLLPHHNRWIQPGGGEQEDPLKQWGIRLASFRQADFRDEEEDKLTPGWPMYFAESKGWENVRMENGKPVVIQKAMGKGTVVLMASSFLLTNAAMVEDRQTAFLARLIGPVHRTIFDETHFGIEETGSIAALARRYHLQGLALGLALVALLFVWKSAAGFPPVWDSLQPAQAVTGEDGSAAFLNLIRRNIRRDDILATCVEEWRKMYQRKAGDKLQMAIDLAESGRKTPARTYAQIQKILGAKQNLS